MTTYQSQTVYTEDREGNSLAFSTVNQDGEEAVLKAAVDVTLPDGQQVLMNVLYDAEDVAGLLAYLHDNFGGRAATKQRDYPYTEGDVDVLGPELFRGFAGDGTEVLCWQGRNFVPQASEEDNAGPDLAYYVDPANPKLPVAGDLLNFQVGDETWTEQVASVTPKAGGSVAVDFVPRKVDGSARVRQCPVIYSGVQCVHEEGHHEVGHCFPGYTENPGVGLSSCNRTDEHHHMQDSTGVHWVHDGAEAACPLSDNHYPVQVTHPQNDAGAVPPPADAQGASNTPQPAGTGQSAAESATAAGTAEAAPASTSAEKPKRKRRTKLEIAYDTAWDEYNRASYGGTSEQAAETAQAFNDARQALASKDPGNSRLAEVTPGAAAPNPNPVQIEPAPVGFAPEQPASPWTQRPDGAAEYNVLAAAAQEGVQAYQQAGQVLVDAANNAGYDVPAFQPGQTPELGQTQVSPEEQQAAQGFPCPVHASDGRPCLRPYGHELQTATNPQPKPHVYATTDPSQLGQPTQPQVTDPLPWSPPPAHPGNIGAATFAQPTLQSVPFQVPPTPEATAPHPETNLQPPAPAAPSWAEPV